MDEAVACVLEYLTAACGSNIHVVLEKIEIAKKIQNNVKVKQPNLNEGGIELF